MIKLYLPNVSDATLWECNHKWDTQLNKSMKLPVANYAEKKE